MMSRMEKFLFFDGSPKFKLTQRYYVIAGIVGSKSKIDSILAQLTPQNLKLKKRCRKKEFKKVITILFEKLSPDFEIHVSVFDSKRFKLSKPEIRTYNLSGKQSHCKSEKGAKGIIGRFWAQAQWLPVERLKKQGDTPILCMDEEEPWLVKICKSHFDNQTKQIRGASFHTKNQKSIPIDDKTKRKCFALVDYIAYYFSESIKRKRFPEMPLDPSMRIYFMFAQPLGLATQLVPF